MDESLAELSALSSHLGANLQQLRDRRGWTQATLARVAGIPRSTVTYLESGSGNPSLSNLVRVARALQVSVEELLSRPRPKVTHVPKAHVQQVVRGGVSVRKLLPDAVAGMEMDRMEFAPGARMKGTPHVDGTKEYLFCERGRVRVYVAGEGFTLEAGDVLAFPGMLPHAYENPDAARKAHTFSVVVLT